MKKHCFTLDLIPDDTLIETYKNHHKKVWPQIEESIRQAGITSLEIYLIENRLFMIMEVNDTFSFEKKQQLMRPKNWPKHLHVSSDIASSAVRGP